MKSKEYQSDEAGAAFKENTISLKKVVDSLVTNPLSLDAESSLPDN